MMLKTQGKRSQFGTQELGLSNRLEWSALGPVDANCSALSGAFCARHSVTVCGVAEEGQPDGAYGRDPQPAACPEDGGFVLGHGRSALRS